MNSRLTASLARSAFFALLGCAFLAAGCVTDRTVIRAVSDPENGFMYGYLNTPDGPPQIINATCVQKGASIGSFRRAWFFSDGTFFVEDVPGGGCWLINFVLNGEVYSLAEFKLGGQPAPREMKYIGSYELGKVNRRLIRQSTFTLQTVPMPDRLKILRGFLKKDPEFFKGSGWDDRIRNEIARLEQHTK